MKHVPAHDRPREKLERLGAAALGDNELMAIVLGGGARECGALDLANTILERTGGLRGVARAAPGDLRLVRGVGAARAAQILAAVELGRRTLARSGAERPRCGSPRQVASYLLPLYGSGVVEQFGIVMLDTKHRVIRTKILSTGSLDGTIVHPREVFREATSAAAAAIILFHNHPSGDPTPSTDDVAVTQRLIAAGTIMGIDVVDHLVLAEQRYVSLIESGKLSTRVE